MDNFTTEPAWAWGITNLDQRIQHTLQDPAYKAWWIELRNMANQAVVTPIPVLTFAAFREFADHGGREEYQRLYFDKRGRVGALAVQILSQTNQDHYNRYISVLEEALWDICNEYTWCLPAHLPLSNDKTGRMVWEEIDLFAAETAGMLAELSTLLQDQLDDRIVERIALEVERRIFKPLSNPHSILEWETAHHNWSAVCGSGCGIAALLLMGEGKDRDHIIERSVQAMTYFLSGYGEDGGCAEGLGYWVYGFGYYTYFADMLAIVEPQRALLLQSTKIDHMAAFPEHIHLSDGVFVNFSDSDEYEILPPGLLSRLGKWTGHRYSLPFHINSVLDDPCRRWAHLIRNLLWSDSAFFASSITDEQNTVVEHTSSIVTEPTGVYLPDLHWMICKSELPNSHVTVALAAKGGHNDEPHNHNDLGSFIIHAGGENIISDLGAGLYTQAYFAPGRERILNISSAGHSVPQIDGQEQQSGREATADILDQRMWRDHTSEYALLEMDLTSAYEHVSLQRYIRHLDWQVNIEAEKATLEWVDQFVFTSERVQQDNAIPQVIERLISKIQPVIEADGVRWQGAKAEVYLDILQAQDKVQVEAIDHVDHEGKALTLYRTLITFVPSIEQVQSASSVSEQKVSLTIPVTLRLIITAIQ